jgi:hypothetical protein
MTLKATIVYFLKTNFTDTAAPAQTVAVEPPAAVAAEKPGLFDDKLKAAIQRDAQNAVAARGGPGNNMVREFTYTPR